jgi:hypothetical protein
VLLAAKKKKNPNLGKYQCHMTVVISDALYVKYFSTTQ